METLLHFCHVWIEENIDQRSGQLVFYNDLEGNGRGLLLSPYMATEMQEAIINNDGRVVFWKKGGIEYHSAKVKLHFSNLTDILPSHLKFSTFLHGVLNNSINTDVTFKAFIDFLRSNVSAKSNDILQSRAITSQCKRTFERSYM